MFPVRMRTVAIGLLGAMTLAGCTSYGRGGGYGGVSVGLGSGGYYDPYYDYGPYGYGYGGWYDGFYYPGNGYYIYDRQGARHRMRDRDREHWRREREARGNRPGVNNDVSAQTVHDAVRARGDRNRGQQGQRALQVQQRSAVRDTPAPAVRSAPPPAARGNGASAQSVHEAVRARSAPRSSGSRGRDRR